MANHETSRIDNFLSANKQGSGLDIARDDSSSVTSKSSASRSGNCKICGELESLPSKPFVKCPSCHKKRMHAFCHHPSVDPRNIPKGWKCKACQDANATPLASVPPEELSAPSPSLSSESSTNMNGTVCKEPGCNSPLFQSSSSVCHKHKVEQQYKNAQAMKPVALNTASGSKPIKKKNLYNWKLDDNLKHVKRKRGPTKIGISGTLVPGLNGVTQPQEKPRISAVSDVRSANQTLPRPPGERAQHFNRRAQIGSGTMDSAQSLLREDFNLSLGSATMAESPISVVNADWEVLRSHSAHQSTLQSTVRRPSDERNTLWAEPGQDQISPGLQELRAIVNPPDEPLDYEAEMERSPVELALDSVQPGLNDQADEDMPDAPATATIEGPTAAWQHIQSATNSSAQTSISSPTTLAGDIIVDAERRTKPAQSLQKKGKQKAATYDHSVLDYYLAKQAEPKLETRPTTQELLKTQFWGHIDPSKVWPKETSEEWLAKKREEIDSRGGRKANFGKLLTVQVRKERWDNGWHIHQTSEANKVDRRFAETTRHVEELFGLKGIDDLIPGVMDGQLVMMEKPAGDGIETRNRKRKGYPVL